MVLRRSNITGRPVIACGSESEIESFESSDCYQCSKTREPFCRFTAQGMRNVLFCNTIIGRQEIKQNENYETTSPDVRRERNLSHTCSYSEFSLLHLAYYSTSTVLNCQDKEKILSLSTDQKLDITMTELTQYEIIGLLSLTTYS